MKKLLILFSILSIFSIYAQDNYKLTLNKAGVSSELILQGTPDKRYSVVAKGTFIVIELSIEKITDNAPRKVMSDKITFSANGKEYPCIGVIDHKNRLFNTSFGGVSMYGQKKEEILVFELSKSVTNGELYFNGQKVLIKVSDAWVQSLAKPILKVSKISAESTLTKTANKRGNDANYITEIQTSGSFAIVNIEVTFEHDAELRAADFFLIDKNGIAISTMGDINDGKFRNSMNTGAIRLSGGRKEVISIVVPIGNLDIKDIKAMYKLSYKGMVEVGL